jgi:hypothetical protein
MNANSDGAKYVERQKELCRLYNVDFERVKALDSKLAALIEKGIETRTPHALKSAYSDVRENMTYWNSIWDLSNSGEMKPKPKQKSLLDLFLYLLLAEGVFSKIVQIVTFLLVEKCHDLYDPRQWIFVEDYEKLKKIDLYVKCQFLKKHEFDLLADSVDRDLRNCIAHLNFIVNEDGSILNKKTKKKIEDLIQKTNYLGCVCAVTLHAMTYSLIKIGLIDEIPPENPLHIDFFNFSTSHESFS